MLPCGFVFSFLLVFCSSGPLCVLVAGEEGAVRYKPPPAPALRQVMRDASSVVLQCQAPAGHSGRRFRLFLVQQQVQSVQFDEQQQQARFQLQGDGATAGKLYCCQYDSSMFSTYLRLPASSGPVSPPHPPAPPQLSVSPPGAQVVPGQVLEFQCQAPPTSPEASPSSFVLMRRGWVGTGSSADLPPAVVLSRSAEPRFTVGLLDEGEGGVFTCLYNLPLPQGGEQQSSPSAPVSITVKAHLPTPSLSHAADDGGLLCTGSPSYPGAYFSLFRQGTALPTATQHTPMVQHSALFTLPAPAFGVQGGHQGDVFQCQYRVLLGKRWVNSQLSAPYSLPCSAGSASCSDSTPATDNTPPHTAGGGVDVALVTGSFSAGLLFLLVLGILGFTLHRHAKRAAEKKRRREQDVFWQQVHSRDHVVDLTLQRVNIGLMDFGEDCGRISVSEPIYDTPFSTFSSQPD